MKKVFKRTLASLLVAVMLLGVSVSGNYNLNAFSIDYSANAMLKDFISSQKISEDSVVEYCYDDFDDDSQYEMFVLVGTEDDFNAYGTIYFVNNSDTEIICDKQTFYKINDGYYFDIFTICSRKFILFDQIPGNYKYTKIYTIVDRIPVQTNISKSYSGEKRKFDENTLSVLKTSFDGHTDSNGNTTSRTEKQYYFYWDETELLFVEYGGIIVTKTQVSKVEGMTDFFQKLDDLNYEVQKIFYRENGILNINCKIKNQNGFDNENINLKYDYQNKKFELLELCNRGNDFLNSSFGGTYDRVISSKASYPDSFLKLKDEYMIKKDDNKTLYQEVLNQYEGLLDLYKKDDLGKFWYSREEFAKCNEFICYSVYDGMGYSSDYKIYYVFSDLDNNGIDELMICSYHQNLNEVYGNENGSVTNAVYTYSNGKIYLLCQASYRSSMRILKNGIVAIDGSGGASYHVWSFYSISTNKKSVSLISDASLIDRAYFVNGNEASFKEFNGVFEKYSGTEYDNYRQSEVKKLYWLQIGNYDNTFYENSYIADIWLSQGREETVENKLINTVLDLDSVSRVIYDDLKNNKSFQNSVKGWTGFKVVFDPEKGIDDIFLSERGLYETLIFDLVKKILYGKSEDTGNIVLDATENVDEVLSEVTKYKGYISKLQTITTAPEKNLLEVLKTWKIDANSTTFFKFYGILNDAEQATAKWSDNKFIEGIGTIADISNDVNEFYQRVASYFMLRDMSDETLMLLEEMKEQTENKSLKNALRTAIAAVKNMDILEIVLEQKLDVDMTLDILGAFFDDFSKGSVVYTTLRTGYKVGVAICDITMNTSKIIDAYKACGATKNFIAANKAAINSLAQKYLSSGSELDAAVYVNAVRSYQYATEIDFENSVSFVKKASEQGLWNQAKNFTAGIINFFLNKDSKTTYESMVESQKNISTNMEQIYSLLDNSWKFNADYLKTDYPDIYPVYVKKEISQKQYAPNINSAYIDKSGTTKINWSFPSTFKDKNGDVQTLWGVMAYDGIEATENIGGYEHTKSYNRSAAPKEIEFYNQSYFNEFNKNYTLKAYTATNSDVVYSAASKVSVSNPLLKPQISFVGMHESGSEQSMFTINDNTNSRYDSVRYIIYRKTANGSWKKIDDIPRDMERFSGKLTLYKDVTAQKGEKYTYKVVSYMKFDNGITLTSPETDSTSIIAGIGNTQLNLNVRDFASRAKTRSIVAEESGIELSWSAVADAAGYEIYRIASYGTIYQLIKTVDAGVTSYIDYDVDAGTTYNYIVCPYNSDSGKTYKLAEFSHGTIDYKVVKVTSVDVSDVKIDYKKSTTLNPEITADEGAEYTVSYSSDSKNVTVDENGKIYAAKKGTANITVTVTDSNGNTVTDTCKVTVEYSFWQWIIVIVLFGWIWY